MHYKHLYKLITHKTVMASKVKYYKYGIYAIHSTTKERKIIAKACNASDAKIMTTALNNSARTAPYMYDVVKFDSK